MDVKNCVLAYSGGLDTSAIVPWLAEQGYAVHAVLMDVGQNENLEALCAKALRFGAETAVIRDAKPDMFAQAIPLAIALGATYEGCYRLGTALARPFIALEQVRRAREIGGATLVHGATGKGNDQIRFEFAYRSLMPEAPVLAPWKTWSFEGRKNLIDYLTHKGLGDGFDVAKDFSIDENLWHLSVEGGPLEDLEADVDVREILAAVSDRFATGSASTPSRPSVEIEFKGGIPTGLEGRDVPLPTVVATLNRQYRHAPWGWDLVIENRFTGIKSRGLYINPAAKLLHLAADGLARSCLTKAVYDDYVALGRQYGEMLYRGEFFSGQRLAAEAAARVIMEHLDGTVKIQLDPAPYVSQIQAAGAIFRRELSTFEKSDYAHQDAQGFINLSWLSLIGRPFVEGDHADPVEPGRAVTPDVCEDQPVFAGRLVSAPL